MALSKEKKVGIKSKRKLKTDAAVCHPLIKTSTIAGTYYGCSLASMYTAVAIPRVIPITHCGPGCNSKQTAIGSHAHQGPGYGGGVVTPSTNIGENEVVFGGQDKLRDLIASSFKVLDADFFVVLTGCIPTLIGDDVSSVVREFQEKGKNVVFADTGGFKGNNFIGHEQVIQAIIDQFVGNYDGDKELHTVNVFASFPFHDAFWKGNLVEIKRILQGIGLKVNILFGHESGGIAEWKDIPKAQFNLVISPWLGVNTAKHLQKKYNQPFLHIPVIPIGANETNRFLREISDFAGLDKEKTENFIKQQTDDYYTYLIYFNNFYSQYRMMGSPAKFAVVGDSAITLSITKFLINQLGLIPTKQIITENPPEEFRNSIVEQFQQIDAEFSPQVEFWEDAYSVSKSLEDFDYGSDASPIILATYWEKDLAKKLHGTIIELSFPIQNGLVLSESIVGYKGAISLIEKIYSTAINYPSTMG